MIKKPKIVPSILSANFLNLEKELKKCFDNEIEMIHYDVMDYDFVPNLTFGPKILKDITTKFNFKIDIHFMVKVKTKKFEDFFKEFIKCKPFMMTMHIESLNKKNIKSFIEICNKNNILPSLSISPETPVKSISKYLPLVKNVLIMSVKPGFGGQAFINESISKVKQLLDIKNSNQYNFSIEIDGGINDKTFKLAVESGAEIIVVGSYLFEAKNFKEKLESLHV